MDMNEMKLRIEAVDGMKIESIEGEAIHCLDQMAQRYLSYRPFRGRTIEDVIMGGSVPDKFVEKAWRMMHRLPEEMLYTLETVFFVYTEADADALDEWTPSHSFDLNNHVGMFVHEDKNIIVNLRLIEKLAKEDQLEMQELYGMDEEEIQVIFSTEDNVEREFLHTLVHELRHLQQYDPMFEELFEENSREEDEEDAESFAREAVQKAYHEGFLAEESV